MNAELWEKIKQIFDAAQEIEPAKRAKFLDKICAGDEDLRSEVERLLASFAEADSFMESPAAVEVASMFEEKKTLLANHTTGDLNAGKLIAGTVLANRYRIIGLLGKGGMGEVYKAEDIKLDQTVALKFLPEKLEKNEFALQRFIGEVRTARQVSHPNVCKVYDIGDISGKHFLSMEFVDGDDLSSLLRRIGRLPSDKATEISRQICFGLHAIHDAGILHRDLKPANVIIDSRGKARITDFGIAGLEEDISKEEIRVGTPAYMSPEQITGKEVTNKSDIYSLGLLLYEIFTGKQAFQAESLDELIKKHQTTQPANPSVFVGNIDPIVEKTINRCLEKSPDDRPKSALQVALALPGGNPLEAAIAAGETPSPAMVAAAPKKGALSPFAATACLASVVVLFAFLVLFSSKVNLHEIIPLDKSPEVLAERADSILKKIGYNNPPTDTAYDFSFDGSYRAFAEKDSSSANRWERLNTGQPVWLYFWYRSSPRYFEPWENADVNLSDPPMDVSGMTSVFLDVRGRLIRFEAIPPQTDEKTAEKTNTDWAILFTEAGLDIKNYKETESKWTPPGFADERKAWEGFHIDHPEIPMRVEAAGFNGKPVYFQIVAPWDKPARETQFTQTTAKKTSNIILTIAFFCALITAVFVARHNLKVGRGDTKGAFRLVLLIFSTITLAQMIAADHVPTLWGELAIFFQIASLALFIGALVWVFYIAVEPFVRRRWSELIISWSRLLAGDFRDPMVGRDILVGGILGLCHTSVIYLMNLMPRALGYDVQPVDGLDLETLMGMRGIMVSFLFAFALPTFYAVASPFLLLLLLAVLRKKWLAAIALWTFVFAANGLAFASRGPWVNWIGTFLIATITVISIARFGLLAHYSFFFFWILTFSIALTSDFSSWYSGATFFSFFVIMGLSIYCFHTSLAGQSVFHRKFFQEE